MLPAKMADRVMLPDKVTEMENSIYYHTSINQSEESISIRCIIISTVVLRPANVSQQGKSLIVMQKDIFRAGKNM